MAVAGRSGKGMANSVASALREAGFVRVLADADGDALAAAGLLARALADHETPFQASVVRGAAIPDATDDTTTVLAGKGGSADVSLPARERPASEAAFEACRELGTDPDPVLALAGAFAADGFAGTTTGFEGSAAFERARDRGIIERRPGVAAPVADLTDGLAHTTLAHAPFSGDTEATAAALDECGVTGGDRRRVASLVALSVSSMDESTPRAAEVVERALRPHAITDEGGDATPVSRTFETVGGYADVLRANAHDRPGTGLALALGHDVCGAALAAWRTHGERAHAALRDATTERYRNAFVARVGADAPLATTARLLCDFRSPEPVALVVAETEAAAAACEDADLGERMREAGAAVEGTGDGNARRGRADFADADRFVAAFREAVA